MRTPRPIEALKHEFSDPENLRDAERGIALGLIVGTVFAAIFTTSDYIALNFDYLKNQNPYGVLWYALNPNFWTDLPYRMYILGLVLAMEFWTWYGWVYRGLVWRGKVYHLSKFLFYAGWFQEIIWMRGSVFQNVTVTLFAPLASIAPWIVVPFMLLQKLPIGWSWNGSDAHWWCAFTGNSGFTSGDTIVFPNGQTLISCPGGWLRWNPAYSWFWSYAMIAFWIIVPTLFWLKTRNRGKWESLIPSDIDYVGSPLVSPVISGERSYLVMDKWFCTLCSEWMEINDGTIGFWFDERWVCWACVGGPFDPKLSGPCCEGGDMCHGECADDE